jgi:hypothetical protein
MAAPRKRLLIKPSLTGPQRQSRYTSLRAKQVLVKLMYQVANSKRDSEAAPGSKREAGCEVVGRA